jgi:hypothetical protein
MKKAFIRAFAFLVLFTSVTIFMACIVDSDDEKGITVKYKPGVNASGMYPTDFVAL